MAKKQSNTDRFVFISSSSRDRELTATLAEILRSNGIPSLSDINSNFPGTDWEKQNEEALRNSTVVISLATENFLSSEWFHSQANMAIGIGKPLIPVIADGLSVSQLPKWAQKIQIVHFPSEQEKLVEAILVIFGDETAPNVRTKREPKREKSTKGSVKRPSRKQVVTPSVVESTKQSHPTSSNLRPLEDKTPFHKDSPSDIDYLGRLGFVEALSQWINRNWDAYKDADKSFVINLHGQWGAGKTTFLNLLKRELRAPDGLRNQDASQNTQKWVVVWFNAWENRHVKPEWWPLFDRIYHESVSQIEASTLDKWWIRLQEWWWRFYSGRKLELLGFFVSLFLLGLTLYWVTRPGVLFDETFMTNMDTTVKLIAAIFSLLSTIFLGTRFVSQTISSGSAKAAEVYLQFAPDPIENIKRHFKDLIERKINAPVIVFIDDLDRCDRTYLVNLLESTQNMLNHGKVFYVISADQRWLFAAFEETYKEFKESIKEPGKKIGSLFLEKIFQLSMSIPMVSEESRALYLDYLVGNEHKMEGMRAQIRQELAGVRNEQELIDKVRSQLPGTIDKVVMREVAVAKSASMEIEQATVHFLSNFAHLMEPNPRAMKRLVTFYGVLRAMAILRDESIVSDLNKRNQLTLWTIVQMRWPLLAEYLEEYPHFLMNFKSGTTNKAIHPDVRNLLKDQSVMDVLRGKDVNGPGKNCQLDEVALKRFMLLKATERTF
jgi:hypothetical protein